MVAKLVASTAGSGIVVDGSAGTGTTTLAALETGRNSISVEIDASYVGLIEERLQESNLAGKIEVHRRKPARKPRAARLADAR